MTNGMTYHDNSVNDIGKDERLSDFSDRMRSASRFLLLVEEIRDELADARGWQNRAAQMLGIDPGYISRLVSGERASVGMKSIASAMDRLGLTREYFYGAKEPASYHDYQPKLSPALAAFFEDEGVSPAERRLLESCDFGGQSVTTHTYAAILAAYRAFGPNSRAKRRNREVSQQTDADMRKARTRKHD